MGERERAPRSPALPTDPVTDPAPAADLDDAAAQDLGPANALWDRSIAGGVTPFADTGKAREETPADIEEEEET
ncbi:MAG TPA: hypothetical protein VNW68_01615 [Candidatus Limnocylindria bacterium]|jgi:hypothetical protein|nr:hypothetical protein [Candidatus Limnocylindria bacterium]